MPYGLSKHTLDKIGSVFSRYEEIEEVILYGSRAKGNYRPGSDVDLTLKGENFNLKLLNKISLDIDDLLLPYAFDISIFPQIKNQDLVDHIERVGRVIYRRDSHSKSNSRQDYK